jgi:recombination protein RecA
MAKKQSNAFIAKIKRDKAFADILSADNFEEQFVSTNCGPVNVLFSGRVKNGGIKKGCMVTIAADSKQGKSLIGLNLLAEAYKSGMSCIVIDSENAFNTRLARMLGVDTDDIVVFKTSRIPEIKQIFARVNNGLTRAESREIFILLDSWGPLVEEQVLEKAAQASSAVNMSGARFKNELANVINAYGNTTFIVNHVYDTMDPYSPTGKFAIPGGKRLVFNSDAIVLASSSAKAKDSDGAIYGKIITAAVSKGRNAKEFKKLKFLIELDGGINPYYGLLEEAIESGVVVKQKKGVSNVFVRPKYDTDGREWKEKELYCAKFWVPVFADDAFNDFLERKFSFEETVLTSSKENLNEMIAAGDWDNLPDNSLTSKQETETPEIPDEDEPFTFDVDKD